MSNPYIPVLDSSVEVLLGQEDIYEYTRRQQQKIFVYWEKNNEWVHPFTANYVVALAHAYIEPQSRWHKNDKVLSTVENLIGRIIDAAVDNRWYHLQPGMGDRNIDRFTALPVMEILEMMDDALSESLRKKAMERLDGILQVQLKEFGTKGRVYPNMDVYYCLMMWMGHKFFGKKEYEEEFSSALEKMENAQFEDGAWTYIVGTNECTIYHDLNVALMGRLAAGGNERARAMVEKSIPYYKQVIAGCGVAEYYTDPWWKHPWDQCRSFGPDIVANITGDRQNRWLGDFVRDKSNEDVIVATNTLFLQLYYASITWKDIEPEAVPDNTVLLDRNIQGPRGRFGSWLWAATGRFGCDTVVGSMANYLNEAGEIIALLGINAEVPHRPDGGEDNANDRRALGLLPKDIVGKTDINGKSAVYEITYRMADPRCIWSEEQFPSGFHWECTQKWTMNETTMAGEITVKSCIEQESSLPRVRIRWGRNGSLQDNGNNSFCYGPYSFAVNSEDFKEYGLEKSKCMPCMDDWNGTQVIYFAGKEKRLCKAGEDFKFSVKIEFKK